MTGLLMRTSGLSIKFMWADTETIKRYTDKELNLIQRNLHRMSQRDGEDEA